jgi:MYXO-CTERM domain-containing protein
MRTALATIALTAGIASADLPQMGGPMSHLLVTIFDQQVYLSFESPHMSTVEMLEGSGTYNGSASVLDHTGVNSQFGWLANGFISLPSNSGVFVRTLSSSDHLSVYSEFGFDPILGTDGSDSIWQWNGQMTHNWYSSDVRGPHSASYEVFVGDLSGNPLEGWGSASIDLSFVFGQDLSDRIGSLGGSVVSTLPAPGALSLLGLIGIGARRRR